MPGPIFVPQRVEERLRMFADALTILRSGGEPSDPATLLTRADTILGIIQTLADLIATTSPVQWRADDRVAAALLVHELSACVTTLKDVHFSLSATLELAAGAVPTLERDLSRLAAELQATAFERSELERSFQPEQPSPPDAQPTPEQ
jgi:hypothetical protein